MDWISEYSKLVEAEPSGQPELPHQWALQVLAFWFETLTPEDWFTKSEATDIQIGERFLAVYAAVARHSAEDVCGSTNDALAAVIVLDQFPRNLFRGNAQSFRTDALAREIAQKAIAAGFDKAMTTDQRVFLYLPFEHSEDLGDQDRSVELISGLGDETYTNFAIAHRDVIARFGRFPHRNAVLGRTSTAEEAAYLAQPGSGF